MGAAFSDVKHARQADVFVQDENGRIVVRGNGGREHIFEASGEQVTSVDERSRRAHENKIKGGERRPVTEEEYKEILMLLNPGQQRGEND